MRPGLRLAGRALPIVGRARLYVCGITPYDTTHLGHAATFVWTDVVARLFRHLGADVDVCRNITDVDDDLLAQARQEDIPWRSLATQQTYRFEDDMRALGITHPTFEPQSHNYVAEVIQLAAALLDRGGAYEHDGGVWFSGDEVPRRACITADEAIELMSTQRYAPRHPDRPLDVPVWQRSLPGEPAWPSPWGDGRPGWHAECAAMALATLGAGLDVHAGGKDLAYPHHAYETALAERATGVTPFARGWLHVGTVEQAGRKMAKSTGNLVFVHDLIRDWPPAAIRLAVLDRPWDADWEFEPRLLDDAAGRLDRLRSRAGRPGHDESAEAAALAALADELDVRTALAVAEAAGGAALASVGSLLGVL